jgi:hypothetical protein
MRPSMSLALAGVFLVLPGLAGAQDLAPPPPLDPNAPPATPQEQATTANLEEGEKKDNKRGLEFLWFNGEVGGSYINMEQFSSTTFALQKSSSGGAMFGLGAGVRLLIFTFGVRGRLHQLSAFNLWQIDGEAGIHIPAGSFDPYLTAHAGYSFVGTLSADQIGSAPALPTSNQPTSGDVSVHGVNAGISGGFDYYFNHFLSLGVDVTVDALFLKRPPVPLPGPLASLPPAQQQMALMMLPPQYQQLYSNSGDSVGFGLAGSGHLGVHF